MNRLRRADWWRVGLVLVVVTGLVVTTIQLRAHARVKVPEIALVIGEPWENMRQRSNVAIDPAIPGHVWGRIPKADARLRFVDPQYGFTTPVARFFSVSFDDSRVSGVRMSPQVEPLPLDDVLKIVLDLQEQWRKHGWKSVGEKDDPPFSDTPEWHMQLRACKASTAYWQADNKYQTLLMVSCFQDDRHPGEERYLITLALAKPWIEP